MRKILTAAILGLAAVALTACSLVATFPSDTRVLDRDSVASEPIPTLIVEAVNYACPMYDPHVHPAINLPAGTAMAPHPKLLHRPADDHPPLAPPDSTPRLSLSTAHQSRVGPSCRKGLSSWLTPASPQPPPMVP